MNVPGHVMSLARAAFPLHVLGEDDFRDRGATREAVPYRSFVWGIEFREGERLPHPPSIDDGLSAVSALFRTESETNGRDVVIWRVLPNMENGRLYFRCAFVSSSALRVAATVAADLVGRMPVMPTEPSEIAKRLAAAIAGRATTIGDLIAAQMVDDGWAGDADGLARASASVVCRLSRSIADGAVDHLVLETDRRPT